MKTFRFRLPAWTLCALIAAAVAAPTLPAQDGSAPRAPGRGMFMMGGNSAHGVVTAIAGNTITIKDEQGQAWKIETGPNTHFRKDREEARISEVHTGDTIVAAGNLDDQAKTLGAVFVVVLSPEQAAQMERMRAEFGKTWTTGRVTSIRDLTLTIERPDHHIQTIAVDENTIFQRRGRGTAEDITFPDIKVGDRIMARGSLQNGAFLAKNLTVAAPHPRGAGSGAPQPQGAPSESAPPQSAGPNRN